MENRILFQAGLRRHRSSLTGIFVLLFLVSLALGTVLTVWANSGRYVNAELNRAGFGTITAWVSDVPDLDGLAGELAALPEVSATETQEVIFSDYTIGEQESDSEGQLITLKPGETRYRFFTDDLSGYRTDIPQIAPGEVYVSPSLASMFGVEPGSKIIFPIARAGGDVSFTVKGFYEDPFMGSSMIGMKGFLICQEDHDALAELIQASGIDALGREGAMVHIFSDSAMTTSVLNQTTCDCKKKLAGMLERWKPTVTLHVPSSKERDADMEEYVRELYRLIPILEEVTGRQVTPQSLAEAINQKGYAQYEMSRFLACRQNNPTLLHGTQVMAAMNAFAYMPPLEWAGCMRQLNDELEERLKQERFAAKANRPRILVTGSPIMYPNLKIPLLIEEMGGMLAADETCMGERELYDPLTVTDRSFSGMMRALAGRYTRPCTCPTFTDNQQRIFRIKQMIKDHQIQGVIYHVLRGCLVYDYEYPVLEEELEKEGIPIIRVESDYNEEDVEQLRIRIEAFIELLKLKQFSEQKARGTA